jgi:hypothetical protein
MGVMFEAIIVGSIVILIYLFAFHKKDRKSIYLAAAISFLWVLLSGLYGYRGGDYSIFGLNLFAFFAWTTGLVLTKKVYDFFKFKKKYWLFVIVYIVIIFTLEYVGYNFWDIKLTTNYSGLFGLEAMHMPWWGKMYYLTIGLLFVKLDWIFNIIRNMFEKKDKLVKKRIGKKK